MTTIFLAVVASLGMYLLLVGLRDDPIDHGDRHTSPATSARRSMAGWMGRSGLEDVSPAQFVVACVAAGTFAAVVTMTVFGPGISTLVVGAVAAVAPAGMWRRRRAATREVARECWPRLIEEVRVLTGSVGRPIPQALAEAGLRGPPEIRGAFVAAQREWTLTTDFERAVSVLKDRLADPTADAVCETLLVVHEVGGDLDARLAALADDRRVALRDHREAESRQAGARVARWFVVIVPVGMAFAGLSLGEGRAAYSTTGGQVATALAVGLIVVCWWWAGRIMQVPGERRVFDR